MVFDPTFHEFDREAAALPDLSGEDPEVDPDAAAGEAETELASGDVEANDLPAYGEQ
jgi:hypothetical protein